MTNKMTLFDLESAYRAVISSITENGGELTSDLEKALDTIPMEISQKMEGYAYIMGRLDHDAEYFRAEAKKFSSVAKGIETAHDRMKEAVKGAMRTIEKNEIDGGRYLFKLKRTQPRTIYDETKVPQAYKIITYILDKDKIKADLKEGFPIDGVTQEESYSLTITPKKGTAHVQASGKEANQIKNSDNGSVGKRKDLLGSENSVGNGQANSGH